MIRLHFKCWGCGKQEVHICKSIKQINLTIAQMNVKGWYRYTFGPGANPWFCGQECGLYSYNSIMAQKWWSKIGNSNKYYYSKAGCIFMPLLVILILIVLNYCLFPSFK